MDEQKNPFSINNIVDENTLKDNLTFAAFYIAMYESFIDHVKNRVQEFLCPNCHFSDDGKIKYIHNARYKEEILERVVDESGNKDETKAIILWFVDQCAITKVDYELFLKIKAQRNRIAHELAKSVGYGFSKSAVLLFFDLFRLYQTIDKWWINEIAIPCSAEDIPPDYNPEEVCSSSVVVLQIMIDVILRGKSEEYKKYVKEFSDNVSDGDQL